MKREINRPESVPSTEKELTFRAIFFGVLIGLLLMALMMYLDAVLGLDTDVAPIASMIGVLLIPLFGGPTNRREVNVMQTCATATTFAAYSLTGNVAPLLMMGQELEILPTFILLFVADAMGICFVSILRDQYVYDQNLPFPGAVMCTTAMKQIGRTDNSSTKLLFGAILFSVVVSFLQNMEYIPSLADFTSLLPVEGMSLGILVMPLMLGMGYVLGSRNALCMLAACLIVCLIEGPIGTKQGWFANPAEDFYAGIQDFNLPVVIGMALFAALLPLCKQWRSLTAAFRIKTGKVANTDRDYSLKTPLILLLILSAVLIGFCSIYYHINPVVMIFCTLLSLFFAMIAVRVFAESGMSAGLPLNIFTIVIAYGLTQSAVFSMLIAFMSFNTFILAQDTMYDLKIGEMVQASPKKQLKSQFIGIFFGCVAGLALFYGIVSAFGFDGELFTYPFGNMYYAVATGLEDGVSSLFNPGRFALGGVLGVIFSIIGLPAGGIALAMYLAPRTIMGIALGGLIRLIVEKTKGHPFAEKMDNIATGLVIGDALVCVLMVIITMTSL